MASDDEEDGPQTYEQRLAMSNQMTDFLIRRTQALAQRVANARNAASNGATEDDEHSSSIDQGVSSAAGTRASLPILEAPEEAATTGASLQTRGRSRTITFSSLGFLPGADKAREPTEAALIARGSHDGPLPSGNASARAERRASSVPSNIRNRASSGTSRQKLELERTLHAVVENTVTRSVEHIEYRCGSPVPFDVHAKLLLSLVMTSIHLPKHENVGRTFARVLRTPLLERICELLFWFLHCLLFQQHTTSSIANASGGADSCTEASSSKTRHELQHLKAAISAAYVKLLSQLRREVRGSKKDTLYKYLPFALCNAVLLGFRFLCPGSRHMYTPALKQRAYKETAWLLLGAELCPSSIAAQRAALFPEEVEAEHADAESSASARHDDDRFQLDLAEMLSRLDGAAAVSGRPTASPSPLDAAEISEEAIYALRCEGEDWFEDNALGCRETSADNPTEGSSRDGAPLHQRRRRDGMRQRRVKFNAERSGPLIKTFMHHVSSGVLPEVSLDPESSSRFNQRRQQAERRARSRQQRRRSSEHNADRAMLLTRTMPVPWCRIGGSQTFRPTKGTQATGREFLAEFQAACKQENAESRRSQAHLRTELAVVSSARDSVLRGGMANIGKFCLDLVTASNVRGPNAADSKHSDTLDWHSHLDPLRPPAQRIIDACDAASKAVREERGRPKTTAKRVLSQQHY